MRPANVQRTTSAHAITENRHLKELLIFMLEIQRIQHLKIETEQQKEKENTKQTEIILLTTTLA